MKIRYSQRFLESLSAAPIPIRKAFNKQAQFLLGDLRHPSLRAKKYDDTNDIWQARVTAGWRFYFSIKDDTYFLHDIIPHPK